MVSVRTRDLALHAGWQRPERQSKEFSSCNAPFAFKLFCPARVAMVLYDEDDELRHRIQCQESIVVISRTKAI